jgi:hypothetical protein
MIRVHRLQLALPFCFNHAGQFGIQFGIILDVLKDQQAGSSSDRHGILHQMVLCLLFGWTHGQHVNHEVSVIQG